MDKQTAINIVRETFQNTFEKNRFIYFSKNILNSIDESKAFHVRGYVPEIFKDHIKTYERIGTYTDPENKKTDILIVYLQKETTLDRARTAQRNFVARYLKDRGEKDAGLIAFVSPDEEDWRFSFVKMEYKLVETPKGTIKAEEEFTPARRYSFLVGKNENSHTAQSSLVPLLREDEHNPTLKEIEEAFSIERVTKEFFEKYCELFLKVKEALDGIVEKDVNIKKDFTQKGVSTIDFAKKLMGQIVFLYFLQKKGWFGVKRTEDWGTGSKHFLRELFLKKHGDYSNFFNDILEPLFYNTLATKRPKDYSDRFDCKIPFLNGGLFDPINDYDWIDTDIALPNELFSNDTKTSEGDSGTGVLDIFDRYNFTVKEDEPLEKEVAIDPEMLGRIFEKLGAITEINYDEYLKAIKSRNKTEENRFNKKFGVYYTPSEVVHYMCKESLINYLSKELRNKLSKEATDFFIKHGEAFIEHQKAAKEKKEKKPNYKGDYTLNKYFKEIKKYPYEIDTLLADIKICDPAVGSGAFLVGMMTEIFKARLFLFQTGCIKEDSYINRDGKEVLRSSYNYKRDAIQNCLYGVDIDPGAIEIAKLRLWLSLIVDEEDIKHIKSLPNLDYKIMQGNSLLETYGGIKLFDERIIYTSELDNRERINRIKEDINKLSQEYIQLHSAGKVSETEKQLLGTKLKDKNSLLKKLSSQNNKPAEKTPLLDILSEAKKKADKLKQLHEAFFKASQKDEKDELKNQIESLVWDLVEVSMKENKKESSLLEIKNFKRSNSKPFFLWKLHFEEVFQDKGGFDIVIANPPYVRADAPDPTHMAFRKNLEETNDYKTLYEKWDLFIPFIEKSLNLLNDRGNLKYITSNSLCTSKYAHKLLDLIQKEYAVNSIDYFENMEVFEGIGVIPVIIGINKNNKAVSEVLKKIRNCSFENICRTEVLSLDNFVAFGRDAFRKDFQKLKQNVAVFKLGDICYISYGLRPNSDERYWKGEFTRDDLISETKDAIHPKAYVEGKFIKSYFIEKLMYLEWDTDRVPKKLVRPTFPELYTRPKILSGRVTGAIYDDSGLVCNDSIVVFIKFIELNGVNNKSISGSLKKFNTLSRKELEENSKNYDLKYLLAILNSKYANFYLNNHRRHRLENYFYPGDFRKLPIPKITLPDQKPFINIVDKILSLTKDNDYLKNPAEQARVKEYERQIDKMVYELYGLTEEEIKIVENFNNRE